jgi:hypothetical protein
LQNLTDTADCEPEEFGICNLKEKQKQNFGVEEAK